MKVGVILNPIAGGGGLVRARPALEAALAQHFEAWEIRLTEQAGDGERLAMAFAASGCDVVIAAGGDGTASEAADGLLQARGEIGKAAALAFLPCGTGTDFARGLRVSRVIPRTIERIAQAPTRQVDVGRICYIDDDGRLASRHFINIASAGLSGATARAVNRDKKKGKVSAKGLFYWHTVMEFLRYRFQEMRISVDDGEPIEARVALVAICNGRFFGGGMMIAPDAEVDDGQFDIVIVRAASKLRLIWDLRLLYSGAHRNHRAISILRGKKVVVEPGGDKPENEAMIEIDGEPPGRIPATFDVLPGVLTIKV